jgi:hypothetical protein
VQRTVAITSNTDPRMISLECGFDDTFDCLHLPSTDQLNLTWRETLAGYNERAQQTGYRERG